MFSFNSRGSVVQDIQGDSGGEAPNVAHFSMSLGDLVEIPEDLKDQLPSV
jgi:hypothetical protein